MMHPIDFVRQQAKRYGPPRKFDTYLDMEDELTLLITPLKYRADYISISDDRHFADPKEQISMHYEETTVIYNGMGSISDMRLVGAFDMCINTDYEIVELSGSKAYSNGVKNCFGDLAGTKQYQPYVRRIMDIFLQVPKRRWQSPPTITADACIALDELFTLQEQRQLAQQYKKTCGREWVSNPRMNLGTIKTPVTQSAISKGIPELLQVLSQLSGKAQAQADLTNRLTSYLMHAGFQQDPNAAQQLISMLGGSR